MTRYLTVCGGRAILQKLGGGAEGGGLVLRATPLARFDPRMRTELLQLGELYEYLSSFCPVVSLSCVSVGPCSVY